MVDLVERKFSSAQFKELIIDRFDPSTSYVHIYMYRDTPREENKRKKYMLRRSAINFDKYVFATDYELSCQ